MATYRKMPAAFSVHLFRPVLLTLGLLGLSACNEGPWPRAPDPAVVTGIEGKLTKLPCIGPMSRWARVYYYKSEPSFLAGLLNLSSNGRWYDFTKVEIDYSQAGFEEFRAGRVLYRGAWFRGIDDRAYDGVTGEYDIPSRTAHITACGPNMSRGMPKDLNIFVR